MLTKGARCLKCTNCICFGLGTGRGAAGARRAPDSSALTHSAQPRAAAGAAFLGRALHPTGRLRGACAAQRQLRDAAKSGSGAAGAWSCSRVALTCGSRGGESFAPDVFSNSPVRLLRRNQVVWMEWKLSMESY